MYIYGWKGGDWNSFGNTNQISFSVSYNNYTETLKKQLNYSYEIIDWH